MKIIEFFTSTKTDREYWLSQMSACDWDAGKMLAELLRDGKLKDLTGEQTLVGLLTDGEKLVSFCIFAPMDEIQPVDFGPWIGFVHTFPEYRGKKLAGILLDYFECIATIMGRDAVYISTDHTGLYEKYGYDFFKTMKNIHGEDCRVYRKILKGDSVPSDIRKDREARGNQYKAEIVAAAKKQTENPVAPCGLSCNHCFLGAWCGNCRSVFNCCSFATLFPKGKCPNLECTKEKGYEGCWECPEIETCGKGFYSEKSDCAADSKAQCLFVRAHGTKDFLSLQDKLHQKYKFTKIQEILAGDIRKSLEFLEREWAK